MPALGVLCKACGEWFSVMPAWMKAESKVGMRTCPWCSTPGEYETKDLIEERT